MKKYLYGVLTISLIVLLNSCQDKQEDKMKQSWRLIKIDRNTYVDYHQIWDFDGTNMTIIDVNDTSGVTDTLDSGTYTVDAGLSKTMMEVEGFAYEELNGSWEILSLNEDILIMLNDPPGSIWNYREFVKE